MRAYVLSAAVMLVLATGVRAEEPPKPRLVTKVFSVADLVIPVPDSIVVGVGEKPAAETPKPATTSDGAERLVRTVTTMVRPYSWGAAGGAGTAEFFDIGSALVVKNTPDVVQEVADLLESLRRLQEVSVCTEVRILSVPAVFCERLGVKAGGGVVLGERELKLLVEAAQGDPRANILQLPKVTTFTGQTATVRCGDRQTFVTGGEVVRVKGQAVFVPRDTPVDLGDTLTLRGQVSADQKYVKLCTTMTRSRVEGEVELIPVVTQITPIFEGGSQGKPIPFTQLLQAPDVKTVKIERTAMIPSGGTVVLGTWTEPAGANAPPILSKVPYINRLFKNVGPCEACGRCEVIVLATARVLGCAEPEPAAKVCPAIPDRYSAPQQVVAPFAQQVRNGTVAENTIWNSYFEPGTALLTKAGAEKLQALAKARPAPDPKVYLQTACDVEVAAANSDRLPLLRDLMNAKRALAVRRYMSTVATGDVTFEVFVTDAVTPSAPPVVAPPLWVTAADVVKLAAPIEMPHVRRYPLRRAAASDAVIAIKYYLDGNQLNARLLTHSAESNTVYVQAEPAVMEQILKLLAAIDAPSPQVMIQGLIMEVPTGFLADIGLTDEKSTGVLTLTPRELAMFTAHIRHGKSRAVLDILSRPQMLVSDNQTGFVQVGAEYPYNARRIVDGLERVGIEYYPIGISMRVTPRVNPDGKVLMRIDPQVTTVSPTPVDLGNGNTAPVFNTQSLRTTVLASDGHSVVLHGLVAASSCVKPTDGPFTALVKGALGCEKREVVIILTPHIVKDAAEPPATVIPASVTPPAPPTIRPAPPLPQQGSYPRQR